jgi:hypothetical protein
MRQYSHSVASKRRAEHRRLSQLGVRIHCQVLSFKGRRRPDAVGNTA